MTGRVRCAHVFCSNPLPAAARSDAQYCSKACKAAARRWRRHYREAVAIGLAYIWGIEDEHVVRCPVCGTQFALGHGHRRDAWYCSHRCQQAAYRERRRAQRVREDVTRDGSLYPLHGADQH